MATQYTNILNLTKLNWIFKKVKIVVTRGLVIRFRIITTTECVFRFDSLIKIDRTEIMLLVITRFPKGRRMAKVVNPAPRLGEGIRYQLG